MTELPSTTDRPPDLRRRLFVMVGLLSLVSLCVAAFSALRLGETNAWLTRTLGESRLLVEAVDTARTAQVHFKKQVQEWKDVLLRGSEPGLFDVHFAAFEAQEGSLREKAARLKGLLSRLEIPSDLVDQFLTAHADLGRRYRQAIEAYDRETASSAFAVDRMVRGIDREATDLLDTVVSDMESRWDARVERSANESFAEMQKHRHFSEALVVIVGCGVIIGIFFSLSIIRGVRLPR